MACMAYSSSRTCFLGWISGYAGPAQPPTTTTREELDDLEHNLDDIYIMI